MKIIFNDGNQMSEEQFARMIIGDDLEAAEQIWDQASKMGTNFPVVMMVAMEEWCKAQDEDVKDIMKMLYECCVCVNEEYGKY